MRSRVTGHRETARALRRLARHTHRPIGEASRAALRPINAAAKANLVANGSVKRGVLYRSMRIRKLKGSAAKITWAVTATGRGVGIAHLVEFGTDPHWQPKRGMMHPGARPKPFLTPAYAENDEDAVRIFGRLIGSAMEAQARRVAARTRRR